MLIDGKSATTDAIRSNPVDSTQQSAVKDRGENKVVVAVASTMERKATTVARR
jgi:hypothetical protein